LTAGQIVVKNESVYLLMERFRNEPIKKAWCNYAGNDWACCRQNDQQKCHEVVQTCWEGV